MARVWDYVEQVIVGPSEEDPRQWIGRSGDEVPQWVLEITDYPRAFDLDAPSPQPISKFPSRFPERF